MRQVKPDTPPEVVAFPQGNDMLRLVMDNAPIGMSLIDADGRIIYANEAYGELLGRNRSEAIGLTIADIMAPEMLDTAHAQLAAVFSGKVDNFRAERIYRRANGTPFWVLVSASAIRREGSAKPAFIIGQIMDIDARKKAEAAVAEAESRWNFALESAGQGVWDHDFRTGQSFYSRTWKLMRGLDPDAPPTHSHERWLAQVHPEDRAFALEQERMLATGQVPHKEFEYREYLSDGRLVRILSRGRAIEWNDDGSVARVIGTDTDVSRLKQSETRLATVIESMAEGISLFDENERLVYCNKQYRDVFPDTADIRVPGAPLVDILRASVTAREMAHYDGLDDEAYVARTRAGLRSGGEWDLALADGRWIHARTTLVPTGGFVSVLSDITSRKRAELDQASLNRRLAELAHKDPLTGLMNRRAFDEIMASEAARARRMGQPIALLLIDVDYFKAFNDAFGHPVGDECLRLVARTLKGTLRRPGDRIARIGGEEFAAILPDSRISGATKVAEKLRLAIRALELRHDHSPHHVVTVSVGVAISGGDHCRLTIDEHLSRADAALYAAKGAGRDRVVVAETETAGGEPPAAKSSEVGDGT